MSSISSCLDDPGTWYEVSCSAIQAGDYCGEDDAHVIDCGQ